jgi:hypothetical protein
LAKGKRKSDKIVSKNMREVFTDVPSTVKASASPAAQRKQQIAIALSKSREEGADIPKAPSKKRGSKASY